MPSSFSVVTVRVEVRDKDDLADRSAAEAVFGGITINGPEIESFSKLDLLSKYSDEVAEAANRKLDETMASRDGCRTRPRTRSRCPIPQPQRRNQSRVWRTRT